MDLKELYDKEFPEAFKIVGSPFLKAKVTPLKQLLEEQRLLLKKTNVNLK
jgi:hypothetical protein